MTRRIAATLALLALLGGGVGTAHSTTASEEHVRYWASMYNVDPEWAVRMELCESGDRPWVLADTWDSYGRGYGLLQIKPRTYAALVAQLNADTRYAPGLAGVGQYDPEYRGQGANNGEPDAHVFAWAVANGYVSLWECRWKVGE